ncbi:MAG TPA: hypothetical protein VFA46_24330 [Actinomycetes bacterium]|jgi:hypothetical protein|nr:hypothetical protein [Actinomycetes bacterium]
MGLAVDDTVDLASGYVPGEVEFHQQGTWAQPYVRYAELIARGGGLAGVAQAHRAVWVGAVEQVDEGEVALFVGHGARLGFADGRFVDVEFRRASAWPSG